MHVTILGCQQIGTDTVTVPTVWTLTVNMTGPLRAGEAWSPEETVTVTVWQSWKRRIFVCCLDWLREGPTAGVCFRELCKREAGDGPWRVMGSAAAASTRTLRRGLLLTHLLA